MPFLSTSLVALAAIIVFCLGMLHLILTFRGNKFWPREAALKTTLESARIYLTPQTTFWKAWLCFNATHSLGALFFGIMYAYLSLFAPAFFFQSYFLIGLGLVTLLCYAYFVGRTGFHTPFRGILISLLCYTTGVVFHFLRFA